MKNVLNNEETSGAEVRSVAPRIPVLLVSQTLFNIGFYAVVPFIAVVLGDDFGLAGAAIGLILGIRTFSQQGLFLVGGALVDRFGAKTIILIGMATRVSGYVLLAGSLLVAPASLAMFVAGTVLTGLGGALFSPGFQSLVAAAESRRAANRTTLFAWLNLTGELGAVLGPLIGALLLGFGFAAVAGAGAVYFALIGLFLAWAIPSRRRSRGEEGAGVIHPPRISLRPVLGDRRFVRFAALHSVDLLAYNQLYLAVPLALAATARPADAVAFVFMWISALTLTAQLPIARWCSHVGPALALRIGYLATAFGFVCIAVSIAMPGEQRTPFVFAAATCLMLGHLTTNPTVMHLVPGFAPPTAIGSYFGLLATLGGIAVLLGNLVVGAVFDAVPGAWAALPWAALALLPATSAVLMPRVLAAATPTAPRPA